MEQIPKVGLLPKLTWTKETERANAELPSRIPNLLSGLLLEKKKKKKLKK
jgi:hypothetical protein